MTACMRCSGTGFVAYSRCFDCDGAGRRERPPRETYVAECPAPADTEAELAGIWRAVRGLSAAVERLAVAVATRDVRHG